MPPKRVFSKADIIEAALRVIRKEGKRQLSARVLAKEMNSSTMPIYSSFDSIKELDADIRERLRDIFIEYSRAELTGEPALDAFLGYVRFAREEKELFRVMCLNDEKENIAIYQEQKDLVLQVLSKQIQENPGFREMEESRFRATLDSIQIFIHGLACLANYGLLADESDAYILEQIKKITSLLTQA